MSGICNHDEPFHNKGGEAKKTMKVSVPLLTLLLLLSTYGCSDSRGFSSLTAPDETSSVQASLKREGVRVVERYFQAVAENRKSDANALLSKLAKKKVVLDVKEIELKNLEARQVEHFDWFTYFRDEGFSLERVAAIADEGGRIKFRAFCTSVAGDDFRIPQVVDFHLLEQDGSLVIAEILPNTAESIREAKETQSS